MSPHDKKNAALALRKSLRRIGDLSNLRAEDVANMRTALGREPQPGDTASELIGAADRVIVDAQIEIDTQEQAEALAKATADIKAKAAPKDAASAQVPLGTQEDAVPTPEGTVDAKPTPAPPSTEPESANPDKPKGSRLRI